MENVPSSSTKGHEARVNEILDTIHDNLLNGISPPKDQKTTSAKDFDDEEVARLIADLNQSIEGTNPQKMSNDEPEALKGSFSPSVCFSFYFWFAVFVWLMIFKTCFPRIFWKKNLYTWVRLS